MEGKAEYEVDHIVRQQGKGKRRQYPIRWQGYDASEDCWLNADELTNAPDILSVYCAANGLMS